MDLDDRKGKSRDLIRLVLCWFGLWVCCDFFRRWWSSVANTEGTDTKESGEFNVYGLSDFANMIKTYRIRERVFQWLGLV
ncbi:hypothetical protein VNO77_06429 [Canavalia gladiata]|uniref:Uncharacterized protein n=1 Tax=Canavalia gladiata TaxID=3824 RepID=A0AAN9R021_CANGL